MGLDMYLSRAKRIGNASAKEINDIEQYISWKQDRDSDKYSLYDWCRVGYNDIRFDLVEQYLPEYIERYYCWDNDKKYPHNMIFEEIGYWRKANQIHNWFVECVQDGNDNCGLYEVSEDQLNDLLMLCKTVLEKSKLVDGKINNGYKFENGKEVPIIEEGKYIEDSTTAEQLLPTSSGFFFGSTNYDQWYYEDIKYTYELLTKIIAETDFENQVICYQSSW